MATFEEIITSLSNANIALAALDLKLDEIKAFIDTLKAGGVITQAQLDQIAGLVTQAKESSDKVLSEVDALDAA